MAYTPTLPPWRGKDGLPSPPLDTSLSPSNNRLQRLQGLPAASSEGTRDDRRDGQADPILSDHPLGLDRLLGMPLKTFAQEGQPLEVRVPWWPDTLFFVPDVRHAEALWREGIARERVWTAGELIALLGADGWTPEGLQVVMIARREFAGEVVKAWPTRSSP